MKRLAIAGALRRVRSVFTGALVLLVLTGLLASGCSSSPPDDPTQWQLDTSAWPDCGWPKGTVVYGTLDGDLWVRSLDSTLHKRLATNKELRERLGLQDGYYVPNELDLSPDRRWIALEMRWLLKGYSRLFAISCDASIMQPIGTNLGGRNGSPKLSPDGKRLAFMRTQTGDLELDEGVFVLDLSSGQRLNFGDHGTWPKAWMPDGKELLIGDIVVDPETDHNEDILYGGDTTTGDIVVRAAAGSTGLRSCTWSDQLDGILCQGYLYRLGKPDEQITYPSESDRVGSCWVGAFPAVGPDGAVYSLNTLHALSRMVLGTCPSTFPWGGEDRIWVFSL
jgi:hypothetical protein